jgi:hypothetical protein
VQNRAATETEIEEMLKLLRESNCPTAQSWRNRNEAITEKLKREAEGLSRQGKMTPQRERFIALSSKPMCDMTPAEHAELDRLSAKSNCPEARHAREQSRKRATVLRHNFEGANRMLKEAGLPSSGAMTPEEKQLGFYFGLRPDEIRDYIGTLRNMRRGLSTVTTPELQATRVDASKHREQVTTLRTIATKGGKATAHYTDAQITNAFADFKQRNPSKTAWDAANALIRPGQALSDWKHVNSPWNRIRRMAQAQLGITREEWFDAL